jgi:formyltetrahydrofolate deformylase
MRMEFRLEGLLEQRATHERTFAERVADPLDMNWRFAYANETKRTAVLASREDHCLLDLLWRWRRHELETDIVGVISNHPDHVRDVVGFGVPYRLVPLPSNGRPRRRRRCWSYSPTASSWSCSLHADPLR